MQPRFSAWSMDCLLSSPQLKVRGYPRIENRLLRLSENPRLIKIKISIQRAVKQIRRVIKERGNTAEMIRKIRASSELIEPKILTSEWTKYFIDDSDIYIRIFDQIGIPQLGDLFVKLMPNMNRVQSLHFGSVVSGVRGKQALAIAQAAYDLYSSGRNSAKLSRKMERFELGVHNMLIIAVRTIACERTFLFVCSALVEKLADSAPDDSGTRSACSLWEQLAQEHMTGDRI